MTQQGATASCPQDGRGYLRRHDRTEDVDVVGRSEPLDGGVEDLAWIWQSSVVHDDTGGPRGAEDPLERLAVAVQILDIRSDRLDLKTAAAQFRSELVERFPAGDECAAEALAAKAPNHAGADSRSGPDQQEMMGVNGLGHRSPPGRALERLSASAAFHGVESPDEHYAHLHEHWSPELFARAKSAQLRLAARQRALQVHGKRSTVANVLVARELRGFIWAATIDQAVNRTGLPLKTTIWKGAASAVRF